MSEIAEFYKGKNVFITGGTGFMGKVLIEKLLYSCPDIGTIYLLMRPKRGKTPEERIRELTLIPLFERIRKQTPEALSKLVVVDGDTEKENLGMRDEQRRILQERVEIVFHAAATVRFNEELQRALTLNVGATLKVLQLCQGIERLKVFLHVSTCFCHVEETVLEEKVYPKFKIDPLELLYLQKSLDPATFLTVAEKLVPPHPNSYTFTKRLSEILLAKFYDEIPVVIVRPSIVFPSFQEPMSGWVDNLNGPIALSVAAGKGALRSMHVLDDSPISMVPVDTATSAMIVAAWKHSVQPKEAELPVYNLSFADCGSWRELIEVGRKIVVEYPFEVILWYPGGDITGSLILHNTKVLLFQWIPAYGIDLVLRLMKRKPFMVKLQRRILDGVGQVKYFTTRPEGWHFKTDKFRSLSSCLSPRDKETFNLDIVEKLDLYEYVKNCLLGTRKYCLHENPETLETCRKRIKYYYAADVFLKSAFFVFFVWLLFILFKPYTTNETLLHLKE